MFRFPRETTIAFRDSVGGTLVIGCGSSAFALFWLTCLVRYDNLRSALRMAVWILAWLVPPMVAVAWWLEGSAVWTRFGRYGFGVGVIGYTFWGMLQQLIFCGSFGTRLRKAVGPHSPPRGQWWRRAGVAMLTGERSA